VSTGGIHCAPHIKRKINSQNHCVQTRQLEQSAVNISVQFRQWDNPQYKSDPQGPIETPELRLGAMEEQTFPVDQSQAPLALFPD
jgi:hypothetical protein